MAIINFLANCTQTTRGKVRIYAERNDRTDNDANRKSFSLAFDRVSIHFDDERDALRIALAICDRLGVDYKLQDWQKEWEQR